MGNRYAERHGRQPFSSIDEFVNRFGFKEGELTEEKIDYRMGLLEGEYQETIGAWYTKDPEELIDGHIDVIVVALGNLAIFGVNSQQAFNEVMAANFRKVNGKKRESDPDGMSIIKPEGWVGPDHSDNHGELGSVWSKTQEILDEIDEILSED